MVSASMSHGRPLNPQRSAGGFLLQNAADDSVASSKVRTKSPNGAMIRSLMVPGWGQLYNEQYIKTGLVAIAEGLLIGGAIVEHQRSLDDYAIYDDTTRTDAARNAAYLRYSRRVNKRNDYLWYLAGAKFLSMVDAYVDAHLYRFDDGPFGVDVGLRSEDDLEVAVVVRWELR
ncbi:DUF5683 domain-containing protein [Candidatus Zixiibacteriota bacterium]